MVLKCKLKQILDFKEGFSKKAWSYQTFLVSTLDQYSKDIVLQGWNDMVVRVQKLHIGDQLEILIDVASREYQSRWYTDIKAIRIDVMEEEPYVEQEPPLRQKAIEQMKVKEEPVQGNLLDGVDNDEEFNSLPF